MSGWMCFALMLPGESFSPPMCLAGRSQLAGDAQPGRVLCVHTSTNQVFGPFVETTPLSSCARAMSPCWAVYGRVNLVPERLNCLLSPPLAVSCGVLMFLPVWLRSHAQSSSDGVDLSGGCWQQQKHTYASETYMDHYKVHWFIRMRAAILIPYSKPTGASPTRSLIQPCFLSHQILPEVSTHLPGGKENPAGIWTGTGLQVEFCCSNAHLESCLINPIIIISIIRSEKPFCPNNVCQN